MLDAQVQRMLEDPKADVARRELRRAVAEPAADGSHEAGRREVPDGRRRAAGCDAARKRGCSSARSSREDRSILDFIDGRFTFVNGPLARYYGIAGVDGEQFQRVELDGEQRSGILTQASILDDLVVRDAHVAGAFAASGCSTTCSAPPPPPPPDNIPRARGEGSGHGRLDAAAAGAAPRQPGCAACHNQMDPIGFGLENYDAAGAWRTKDGNFDIDTSGTLPDGRTFTGAKGLKQILAVAAGASSRSNFTEKLMTYALGRGLERADRPVVDQIASDVGARQLPVLRARDGDREQPSVSDAITGR